MGTRGLAGFRLAQQDKLFYNHFDSYPGALGADIVAYAKSITDWDVVKAQVAAFHEVKAGEKPTQDQITLAQNLGTVDTGVSTGNLSDWYCLTRKAQGDIRLCLELGFGDLNNAFAKDSLFCEFAYIINLDTMELEFYKGFNENPNADGRYARLTDDDAREAASGTKYYGIKLVGTCPLNAIPDDWLARFYPAEAPPTPATPAT